ncbi:MAG: transcription termination/antitermination protein NusG [Neisseriaceae bacterium]
MAKQWYVVHAYSGFEKKVVKHLKEHVVRNNLEDKFGEILIPTEEVVDIKDGKKKITERKFFPGYILIQMEMSDETWHLVKSTPKINGFIGGTAHKPVPISQREVDRILNQVQSGVEKPKPKVEFEVGEHVRVTKGPFADFNGMVEEANYERNKLKVSVQIFGRETPVELDFTQVEKV